MAGELLIMHNWLPPDDDEDGQFFGLDRCNKTLKELRPNIKWTWKDTLLQKIIDFFTRILK